jgi:hypothetical protein
MKDPSDIIRIWLYNKLNNAVSWRSVSVPVYAFAPRDAAKPYILLASQAMGSELEESTKDAYITKHDFTIEIYDGYSGNDGSFRGVNSICNDILVLVRTRAAIPMTGYNVISLVVNSTITDTFDNGEEIIFFKAINITLTIEEL